MGEAPVIVIGGPTASGKSGLALEIAERLDGAVINGVAIQVYRDLHILTARPSEADEKRIPHRLYGVLDATETCSAGRWQALALAEIEAATAAGKRAIVVGGTGLYLRALTEGIAPIPDIAADIRAAARARFAEIGNVEFHAELTARDPVMAARLQSADGQRLMRAWEVLEATGRSLAAWQEEPVIAPDLKFTMVALMPPRDDIYAACDGRMVAMVADGVLDEVAALMKRAEAEQLDPGLPVLKALGYAELASHLSGETTLEAAIVAAQQKTRRYAKRQMTWFRHQLPDRSGDARPNIQLLKYSYINYLEIFSNIS
ncbi:MAG: tRNA (adenosine(37)-N6)-dimethylallyltransferase MiaA [Alphaproteobacteria bacterium]|nr:tRNA (adenosine(37)-N6)-dimethylallyltransferase MiaA [Alphaproteobacteria bacterium]